MNNILLYSSCHFPIRKVFTIVIVQMICYHSLIAPVILSHNKEQHTHTRKDKVNIMTRTTYFREMLKNITSAFAAERSCEQENYRELINGGFNYAMRSRTLF